MAERKPEELERLEREVEKDLGIKGKGKGQMTTEEAGKIGGNMVKRLIEEGEEAEKGRRK